MRLSEEAEDARIVELYRSGWSFRKLQKRYHRSPNDIAKLVKGIEVKCTMCSKPKGKVHFHAHHPDRLNRPNYTIPLCPSCHAKEEARLRTEKGNQSLPQVGSALPPTENLAAKPSNTSFVSPMGPLPPTVKNILICGGIALGLEALFPGFFERRWQELQAHWRRS